MTFEQIPLASTLDNNPLLLLHLFRVKFQDNNLSIQSRVLMGHKAHEQFFKEQETCQNVQKHEHNTKVRRESCALSPIRDKLRMVNKLMQHNHVPKFSCLLGTCQGEVQSGSTSSKGYREV